MSSEHDRQQENSELQNVISIHAELLHTVVVQDFLISSAHSDLKLLCCAPVSFYVSSLVLVFFKSYFANDSWSI